MPDTPAPDEHESRPARKVGVYQQPDNARQSSAGRWIRLLIILLLLVFVIYGIWRWVL